MIPTLTSTGQRFKLVLCRSDPSAINKDCNGQIRFSLQDRQTPCNLCTHVSTAVRRADSQHLALPKLDIRCSTHRSGFGLHPSLFLSGDSKDMLCR